jgi:hypothetical protein
MYNRGETQVFLNERMRQACINAKAAGVEIYTILFRETDPEAINLYRQCATSPAMAFQASNGASLMDAFEQIGDSLAKLRLTK